MDFTKIVPADDRVVLNVGGRLFETEKSTLLKGVEEGKESFFHALLRHFEKQPNRDPSQPFWIDRDGEIFAVVLSWLRNPCMDVLVSQRNLELLKVEADYYLLPLLVSQVECLISERKSNIQLREQRKVQHAFLGGLCGALFLGIASAAAWYFSKPRQQQSLTDTSSASTTPIDVVDLPESIDLNERISSAMWTLHKRN